VGDLYRRVMLMKEANDDASCAAVDGRGESPEVSHGEQREARWKAAIMAVRQVSAVGRMTRLNSLSG